MEQDWRPDFEQAIGETFGDHVSPQGGPTGIGRLPEAQDECHYANDR
ncbi:MAG: hypothetical protein KDA86_22220 [Planctomycetaceae bacterium]|nr:hypothetical protein [Planctomycetaceae bacterium]